MTGVQTCALPIYDFEKSRVSLEDLKHLAEISSDAIIHDSNNHEEYTTNRVQNNFTYNISFKDGVDPIYRVLFDLLESTTVEDIRDEALALANVAKGLSEIKVLQLWIVSVFPLKIAEFYGENGFKNIYVKELGKHNLEKVTDTLNNSEDLFKYFSSVASKVCEEIEKRIPEFRNSGIMPMYAKTTLVRVGIRLFYKIGRAHV